MGNDDKRDAHPGLDEDGADLQRGLDNGGEVGDPPSEEEQHEMAEEDQEGLEG